MINLLPLDIKQSIIKAKKLQRVLILIFLVLISGFCFGGALFLIKIDIQSKLLSEENILENKTQELGASEIKDLENEINAFNNALSKIDSFRESGGYVSDILDKIFKSLPANIYLVNLSYDKSAKEISVAGFSPDRDILSEFKTNLEGQEAFEEIYFPSSNWAKSVDIDFFVRFKVKQ